MTAEMVLNLGDPVMQAGAGVVKLVHAGEQASFDMLVLGCGGGPIEDNLSAYLVKPKQQAWSDGFVSVDGGSCLGALTRLLKSHPQSFRDFELPSRNYGSPRANAGYILSLLQSFLITHAHWDHISGMVLSSGSAAAQKSVYGSKQTLENLSSAMNGGLWPALGSFEEANGVPYIWRTVEGKGPVKPSKGLSACIRPLSHGRHHNNTPYASSAYFIENEETGKSFLIFGDVEPDSLSGENYNMDIWQDTARRIADKRLSTLFIECSYCSSRSKAQMYGHFSPVFIFEELRRLAALLPPRQGRPVNDLSGRLKGLNIGIIHIKDSTNVEELHDAIATSPVRSSFLKNKKSANGGYGPSLLPEDIASVIRQELSDLETQYDLGARFVILEQGMRLEI